MIWDTTNNNRTIPVEQFLGHVIETISETYTKLAWVFKHFLYIMNGETLKRSLNVVSFYSDIQHDYGIAAIYFWSDKYAWVTRCFTKRIYYGMCSIYSIRQCFKHSNQIIYKQKLGRAMGTIIASMHANFYK